jgi:hypothetical protein
MANQKLNITIKAFDKTKKAFSSATAGLKKVGGAVLSAKTAIVGLVGAAGFGALISSSLRAGDSLAKTASKIGVTTEALSGLRYAAELTGVSSETMDMALQRFTRRASEAALGTGEAVNALKELNLDAESLVKLPLDQQMGMVADAMASVGTQSDRVRLAMKLFDSEGVALVNTLAGGSVALETMAEEAEELGITLDSVDAKAIEDANDAFTRAKTAIMGLVQAMTVELAPIIEDLSKQFVAFIKKQNESGNVGEKIARMLISAYERVRNVFIDFESSVVSARLELAKMEWFIRETLNQTFGNLINIFNQVIGLFNGTKLRNPFAQGVADTRREIADLQGQLASLRDMSNMNMANQMFNSGGQYVPYSQRSSYDGGGFTGGGARAGGMDGKGGFPAMLHPNETVIDHTKGQSQGVVINQTINVTTGVQSTVRAEITNLLPQIQEASKQAVLNAKRRGGSFASQLVGR